MAVFAVSITKTIPWRGKDAEFSNVYHYKTQTLESFNDIAVIDNVVAAEKLIHASSVKFVRARTWGPTEQGQAASKMREVKDLSGVGSRSPATSWYPELAVMVYWPLGRYGVRNHPQYLRKWLHLGYAAGLPSDGSRATVTTDTTLPTYMSTVESIGNGVGNAIPLCTPDGEHLAPLGQGAVYKMLEHRQIGR